MDYKIGVYVCECGPNIGEKIDIDEVVNKIGLIDEVAIVKKYSLLCSVDGKKYLESEIKKNNLTHLVVAACSPKQHDKTFMEVCEKSGINPYLYQLANIREQCAWITDDKDEATSKAIRMIKAAISRVKFHSPLEKKEIESNPDVLVIGGGIAGIETCLELASNKRKVILVEKSDELGGIIKNFEKTYPTMNKVSSILNQKILDIQNNKNIKIFTNSEAKNIIGFFGNFEIEIFDNKEEESEELKVGAVVLATGSSFIDLKKNTKFGYGKYDNVISSLEFEKMNLSNKILLKNGKPPKSVAIIYCVGRNEVGYCSSICCMYSIKFNRYLQEKISGASVTNFYSDLCIPGKTNQYFYEESKNTNIKFLRSNDVNITEKEKKLVVNYLDENDKKQSLLFDMIILSPAITSNADSSKIAEISNISQDDKGFFEEEHEKLNPVSTTTDGIYIIGSSQEPKSITDTIIQAGAASGRILSSLIPGKKIEPEVKISKISESFCIGCKTCINVCSYGAIEFDESRKISVVNEVICRGCGNCVAACPSGAASIKHINFNQIYQEILEAVNE